jgi:hypothetical protein
MDHPEAAWPVSRQNPVSPLLARRFLHEVPSRKAIAASMDLSLLSVKR